MKCRKKTSKRGMGIDMGARETNAKDAGEAEESSGGKGAEGAKATPWETAAKGCCRIKSDILVEEPKTPKRFRPASKNHWDPRQLISSASDPMGLEQCAPGCPREHQCWSGERKWGIRQERTSQKKMQGDLGANGPKMPITLNTAMVFTHQSGKENARQRKKHSN